MPKARVPSPARSQGDITTPKRKSNRGSRSLCSPALSTASGRLTSLIDQFKDKNMESFALSPLSGRSVLNDNTDIQEPKRKSWWKKLNENTLDIMEVLEDNKLTDVNNVIEELIDIEVLSQEKKNYTLDLPESSDNESINSIVLPQRKLFTQKENQPQKKFSQFTGNRESLAKLHKTNTTNIDKTVNVGTRELFQNTKRSKPIFPAALLNMSPNKTAADKTKENVLAEPKPQVRSIFGNRPANKRKNMFADFIVSESEDEIPEIQPKVFGFQRKLEQRRVSSISKGKDGSPTSSITTDIEMEDWKLLPSSTMVENQLEDMVAGNTPIKRARLSKLSEAKESDAGTNTLQTNTTADKTKQSNKSVTSKNKSKSSLGIKDRTLDNSRVTRSKVSHENCDNQVLEEAVVHNDLNESEKDNIIKQKSVVLEKDTQETEINKAKKNKSNLTNKSIQNVQKPSKTVEESVESQNEQNSAENNVKGNLEQELEIAHDQQNKKEENIQEVDKGDNINRENRNEESVKKDNVVNISKDNEDVVNKSQEIVNNKTQEEANHNQEVENKATESEEDEANETVEDENVANESEEDEIPANESEDDEKPANESEEDENPAYESEEDENPANESDEHEDEDEAMASDVNEDETNQSQEVEANANESQELEEIAHESQIVEDNNDLVDENDEEMNEEAANESQISQASINESLEVENDEEENHEVESDTEVNESEEIKHDQEIEDGDEAESDEEIDEEAANESQISQDSVNESQEVENDEQESHEVESDADVNESEEIEDNQPMEDSDEDDKAIASDPEISDQDDNEADEMEIDNENEEEPANVDESEPNESREEIQTEEHNEIEPSAEEIEESPNVTHDTTGRHRKKHVNKSPEAILQNNTNQIDSFSIKGRNTSVRKTKSMIKNLNIRPSLAPRDSTGISDGTRNSSAEGSGWDSHRTTRKTLRQTFGKDFTPRKSLRALVMEKSAKRQIEQIDVHSETVKYPQANSTELPEDSNRDFEDAVESDHEVSRRTRLTTLEMYLQKMKQQNIAKKLKMEEAVRNSLKGPAGDPLNINLFKVPNKPPPRRPKPQQSKPKKQIKSVIPFAELPSEVIEDLKYKPPKRFQPSNASWITKRLYKFLESKLEAKYDYKARVRAEKLVETIYDFAKDLRRRDVASADAVDVLKHEFARLEIVSTHFEFYEFFHEFMPREVRVRVVPDIVNKIPLPRHGVFSNIL